MDLSVRATDAGFELVGPGDAVLAGFDSEQDAQAAMEAVARACEVVDAGALEVAIAPTTIDAPTPEVGGPQLADDFRESDVNRDRKGRFAEKPGGPRLPDGRAALSRKEGTPRDRQQVVEQRPAIQSERDMSVEDKIRAFKTMHGRPPSDAEVAKLRRRNEGEQRPALETERSRTEVDRLRARERQRQEALDRFRADAAPGALASFAELADADGGKPKSRLLLFKLGKYRHPKFGAWNISRQVFDSFLTNFRGRPVPIDLDHAPEKQSGSTEAAGWVTNLEVVGDDLYGDVEWTPIGASAIKERRYRYISPTWSFAARDQHGEVIGPKLIGAGCTNRPFFDWPTINFSSQDAGAFADDEHEVVFASWEGPPEEDTEPQLANGGIVPAGYNLVLPAGCVLTTDSAGTATVTFTATANRPGGLQVTEPFLKLDAAGNPADCTDCKPGERCAKHKEMADAIAGCQDCNPGEPCVKHANALLGYPDDKQLELAASVADARSDSRRPMDREQLIEIFGLAADATDDQVAEAAREANAVATQVAETLGVEEVTADAVVTAAQQARERAEQAPAEGSVVLTAAEFGQINERLVTLETEVTERRESDAKQRFDRAWADAVDAGRAAPALEDHFRTLYDRAADTTLTLLAEAGSLVNVNPAGKPGNGRAAATADDAAEFTIHGESSAELDRDGLELHRRAETLAREQQIDYAEAYIGLAEGTLA